MQWSSLKKQVESRFAPSLSGRVELRTTHYRHAHDSEGRGWITIDKEEVHNFCTLKYWVEQHALLTGIRTANNVTDYRDPAQQDGYYHAYDQAEAILNQRGVRSQDWFEESLRDYLSLPIEESLTSTNFLHRALAVIDRRLGKRRIKALEVPPGEHALLRRFLELRRTVEFPKHVPGAAQPVVAAGAPKAARR